MTNKDTERITKLYTNDKDYDQDEDYVFDDFEKEELDEEYREETTITPMEETPTYRFNQGFNQFEFVGRLKGIPTKLEIDGNWYAWGYILTTDGKRDMTVPIMFQSTLVDYATTNFQTDDLVSITGIVSTSTRDGVSLNVMFVGKEMRLLERADESLKYTPDLFNEIITKYKPDSALRDHFASVEKKLMKRSEIYWMSVNYDAVRSLKKKVKLERAQAKLKEQSEQQQTKGNEHETENDDN